MLRDGTLFTCTAMMSVSGVMLKWLRCWTLNGEVVGSVAGRSTFM